jgi:hypothetical protein
MSNPARYTREITTAGLGGLRGTSRTSRAGVGAMVSSAEIAHGRLRRIKRYDIPARRCFFPIRLVHLSAPSNPVTLYTSSPSSSGSASTTLLAFTFRFSQTTHANNKQTNLTVVASTPTSTASLSETLLKTPRARDIHSPHTFQSSFRILGFVTAKQTVTFPAHHQLSAHLNPPTHYHTTNSQDALLPDHCRAPVRFRRLCPRAIA